VGDARSLAIQSVLFNNSTADVLSAVRATANSVLRARDRGVLSGWVLQLGDCSPTPVLDGRAIDAVRTIVASGGGSVDHTFFGQNLGSAAGHNSIASAGDSDVMLILNPDVRMAPDAVTELLTSLTPDVGVAEARQLPLEHPKVFAEGTGDTSWASTACAATPRALFDRLGGFDATSFFLYCDDVDYSWRVRLEGLRVVYVPAAAVFHDKRLTNTGDLPDNEAELYYSAEAALLLAHKYSRPDLLRSLLKSYRITSTPRLLRAAADYADRRASGRLPAPIDARHTVAQFRKVHYAEHRY
jgi:GT2 family glycosyltransferase